MNKLIKVGRLTVNNNAIGWVPDPEAILANCGDGKDVFIVPDIHPAIFNPPPVAPVSSGVDLSGIQVYALNDGEMYRVVRGMLEGRSLHQSEVNLSRWVKFEDLDTLPHQPVEPVSGQAVEFDAEIAAMCIFSRDRSQSGRWDDLHIADKNYYYETAQKIRLEALQHRQPKAVATIPTWEEIGAAYDHGVINGKQGTWQHRNGLEGIVALLTSHQEGR